MIAYLEGKVLKKNESTIIVLSNNVGYEIYIPNNMSLLLREGGNIELPIYHHINDAGQSLFGFSSFKEREFFIILISVSGIGPKSALQMLDVSIEIITRAILDSDTDTLKGLPGVGNKTAERMIVELKNKITYPISANTKEMNIFDSSQNKEISDALMSLGYSKIEISNMIAEIPSDIEKTEDIIKYVLKNN